MVRFPLVVVSVIQVADKLTVDDGSGTVTILEAYRALIAADFHPVRAVEFHWYSAEVDIFLCLLGVLMLTVA